MKEGNNKEIIKIEKKKLKVLEKLEEHKRKTKATSCKIVLTGIWLFIGYWAVMTEIYLFGFFVEIQRRVSETYELVPIGLILFFVFGGVVFADAMLVYYSVICDKINGYFELN